MQEKNIMLPDYEDAEFEDYRIRVNDEIIYRLITDNSELATLVNAGSSVSSMTNQLTYQVMEDGTIDLPFIRNIYVKDLTVREATEEVQRRFREIVSDAVIKLAINKTFTVIGEISSGVYPIYKERMTIYQALALTGDIMHSGDRKNVKIIREKNDGTEVLEFDIRPASLIKSEYYYIYPNDIIYVQRSKSSFFKVENFTGFLGLINTTITLFTTVLMYTNQK